MAKKKKETNKRFGLGDIVEWSSQSGGVTKAKKGEVVWVIPAEQEPPTFNELSDKFHDGTLGVTCVRFDTGGKPYISCGTSPLGSVPVQRTTRPGPKRDYENYVVRVGRNHYYRPVVALLKKVKS